MRVLGVDPGLERTGLGVVESEGGRLRAVEFRTVQTPGEAAAKLMGIARAVREMLATNAPEALCMERLFFNANARTVMGVGQACGVVLLVAAEAGIPVVTYTPPEVKLAVTGSGTAAKPQVQFMVKAILGLDAAPKPADTADALAVAICHLQRSGIAKRIQSAQARPQGVVA
ncbi:MAG: crossover junction endodeoxyribonuclease RuvC [Actinomycetota bacterium]